MSLKREVDKMGKDVKDGVDEARHRGAAEAEREDREVAGDVMTPGERVASHVNEAKHEVLAEVDKAKRKLRDAT